MPLARLYWLRFQSGLDMKKSLAQVVVIGASYIDMAVKCPRIPLPGQSVAGFELSCVATGPGPNQAAQAALCGCDVHLISKVGNDIFAQFVRQTLDDFSVNTEFLASANAKSTGVVVTLVDSSGENAICDYSGANSALTPEDIKAAERVIAQCNVCLIDGRLPQDTIVAAIRTAKLFGKKVILNPARPIERSTADTRLPPEYFSADILIPNIYEAADIAESGSPAINIHQNAKLIGSDLVARGAGAAVITMGRRGCLIVDRYATTHVPAFEVELVDQTARGDAFAGALAACCAVQDDLTQSVKFASAAGALACTKFGSIESLPSKEEIIELLQKQEL